jgi:hypothetical protein
MLDTPDRASRTNEFRPVTSRGRRRQVTRFVSGQDQFKHPAAVNRVSTVPSLGYASSHLLSAVDFGTATHLHPSTTTIVSCLAGSSDPRLSTSALWLRSRSGESGLSAGRGGFDTLAKDGRRGAFERRATVLLDGWLQAAVTQPAPPAAPGAGGRRSRPRPDGSRSFFEALRDRR